MKLTITLAHDDLCGYLTDLINSDDFSEDTVNELKFVKANLPDVAFHELDLEDIETLHLGSVMK